MSMGVALAAHPFSETVRRTLATRTMRAHGLTLMATAAATAIVLLLGGLAAAPVPPLCQHGTLASVGWAHAAGIWLVTTFLAAMFGVFPLLFIARMHAKAPPTTPASSPKPNAALAALLRSPVLKGAHPHSPLVALLATLLEMSTWTSAVLHALSAVGFTVPVLLALWRLTPSQAASGVDPTCAALTSYSLWAWRLPAPPALPPRKLLVQPWPLPGTRALDMRPNELVIVALASSLAIGATLSIVADIVPAFQAWDLSRPQKQKESGSEAVTPKPALLPPTRSWLFTAPALRVHAVAPLSVEQSILYSLFPSQIQTPLLQWHPSAPQTWYGPAAWTTLAGLSLPVVVVVTMAFSVVGLGFYPFIRRCLWASFFSVIGPAIVPSFRRPLWAGAYFAFSPAFLRTSWSSPGITLLSLHLAFAFSWTIARILWFVYISQPLHTSSASRKPGLQPTLQSLENEYAPFAFASLASAVGTMPEERSAIYKHVPATGMLGSSWATALKGSVHELTLFDQRLGALLAPKDPAPATATPAPASTDKPAPKPVEAASSSIWERLASDAASPRQRFFTSTAAEPPKNHAVPRLPAPPSSGSDMPLAQAGLASAQTHIAHYALLSGAYLARALRAVHALMDAHLLPRAPVSVQNVWRSSTERVAERALAALHRSDVLVDRALVGPVGTRGGSAAAAAWAAQVLCALVVHSLEEDPYGTVQRDVPTVVSALTGALEVAGPCTPSSGGTDVESDWAVVHSVLRASLRAVRDTFFPFTQDLNWGPLDPGGVRAWERMERALKKATEEL